MEIINLAGRNYECDSVFIDRMAAVYAKPDVLLSLCNALTIKNRFTDETMILYDGVGLPNHLLIPRGIIEKHAGFKTWENADIKFIGNLRPDQSLLAQSYMDHIETHNGGIIKAPTGKGKTIIAFNIMARLGLKTLVIVPYSHLIEQWIHGTDGNGGLLKFTDLKIDDIGICRADKCDFKDKKVVIGMIHSIAKVGKYPEKFYNDFGLAIFEEIHRIGAPTFANAARMFNCKYRLGLSATPVRRDGMDKVFLWHIGEICTPKTKAEAIPFVLLVSYKGEDTNSDNYMVDNYVFGRQELDLGRYINKVARSKDRNALISALIAKAYKQDRDILVLSDRILQLEVLRKLLMMAHNIPEFNIGTFTGKVKEGLDRKILLATYGSAGTGLDIPKLSTLVMATPRADPKQAVGRILRGVAHDEPLVIDLIDESSQVMKGWKMARLKWYEEITNKIKHYDPVFKY